MQAFTRAFVRRGGAACAAAAVLIGGTFAAGAATAAPQSDPTPAVHAPAPIAATPASATTAAAATATAPSATAAATATQAPDASAPPTDEALPDGLAEAVKRDLGMSMEEFKAQGQVAKEAAAIQDQAAKTDPSAVVSVSDNGITVHTSVPDSVLKAADTEKTAIRVTTAKTTPGKLEATSVDALFNDYVKTFGIHDLLSVAQDSSGNFIIRTGALTTGAATPLAKPAALSVSDFAARYGNVTAKAADGPGEAHFASAAPTRPPFASGDPYSMVDGQGYYAADAQNAGGELCTVGWNGFNKMGKPAVISAGHCTSDGRTRFATLTNPANDTAATGPAVDHPSLLTPLGTIGFSQYGGPGNSWATLDNAGDPSSNIGTDVSVIDNIPATLTQVPRVDRWSNAISWGALTPEQIAKDAANVAVTGVGESVLGAKVCKSGRTTGWTCGTVDEKGAYAIAGIDFPTPTNPKGNPNDIRAIRGFASVNGVTSNFGDSGGPAISGTTAMGMLSGGGTAPDGSTVSIFSELKPALTATNGYTVKVFVNSPTLTIPADNGTLHRSTTITGKVAGAQAGTKVTVSLDSKTSTVPTAANGEWSVKAPNKFGTFKITAQARSGFSSSAVANFSVRVVKQTLAAPTFTAPALNGSAPAPVKTFTGTGKPGATVELSLGIAGTAPRLGGGMAGTAVVGATGKWSKALSPALAVGSYTVTARQTLTDWNDSTLVTSKFKVVPDTPAIGSPTNGQKFPAASAPMAISGSNTAGATVSVTINGQKFDVKVVGGTWTVAFGARFVPGNHSVSVTQTIAGLTSAAAKSSFTVLAIPAPPAVQQPSNPGSAPAAPATQPSSDDGRLAVTGASSTVAGFGAAGGVLLLAGAALKLFRRRKGTN